MAHIRNWTFLILFIFVQLVACGSKAEPTPIPEEPTPLPLPSSTVEVASKIDLTWAKIQETGVMVVGTSIDYPPFAFYKANHQVDGFDVALIREVAARMGVELKFQDMPFNSLIDALQIGQIDVAISAMSATPEREAFVDFSDIYYVGEDAILGTAASAEITTLSQLENSRIGVQSQSVYENWVRQELLEPGLINKRDMYIYAEANQAVKDLRNGRLDYVILDLKPAELAAVDAKLSIVGQGLNSQRFAIAMPTNSSELQTAINRALTELQNEGVIEQLAANYLDIENLLPIDPVPQITPHATTNAVGCVDAMAFITHLNLDDKDMTNPPQILPGEAFRKGWRVQNVGTCTWNSTYALTYVDGSEPAASMGGSIIPITGEINSGEFYDFYVDLVAPIIPDTYQGFWSMQNGAEEFFGQRIWVGISVVDPAIVTPAVTPTPTPEINFTVDRTQIKQGECVRFAWEVKNIQAVYFYAENELWDQNGMPGTGYSIECPQETIIYYLRVIQRDGSEDTYAIPIIVQSVAGSPVIEEFVLSPSDQIVLGQCVTIRWIVTEAEVMLSRNDFSLWEGAPIQGYLDDCPPVGTMTYVLEASGPNGTSRVQKNLSVVQGTTETAVLETTPQMTPSLLP